MNKWINIQTHTQTLCISAVPLCVPCANGACYGTDENREAVAGRWRLGETCQSFITILSTVRQNQDTHTCLKQGSCKYSRLLWKPRWRAASRTHMAEEVWMQMRWNASQRETHCAANTMWVHSAFPWQPGSMFYGGFLSSVVPAWLASFMIPEEAVFVSKASFILAYTTKHITFDIIPHIVSHILTFNCVSIQLLWGSKNTESTTKSRFFIASFIKNYKFDKLHFSHVYIILH